MLDVDAQGLGDAQAEQTEQAGQGLVDDAACGSLGNEGAQLHAVEAQGGRLGVDHGPADVLGRRGLDGPVDDGEPVEAGDGRQTSRSCSAHQAKYWRRSVA